MFVNTLQAQETSKSKSSAKLYERGDIKVFINNADKINSKATDYSPCYYNNGIVFVSSRLKNGPVDRKTGETFYELFYSELDNSGLPLPPDKFSQYINTPNNEGPVSFSNLEDVIYFTSNNNASGQAKSDKKGITNLKIYQAVRGDNEWVAINELPFCSDNFSTAHPSLSADGSKLYFSSNRPGGYGGMDLYVVDKIADRWSAPKNLGPKVNTAGNELFPNIFNNDVLFFSSSGHGGSGGLGVFYTDVNRIDGFEPIVLPEPINSTKDDLGFIVSKDGTKGFFSSNRSGGIGQDDIYSWSTEGGPLVNFAIPKFNISLKIFDEASRDLVPGAVVYLLKTDKNGASDNDALYEVELINEGNKDDNQVQIQLARKKIFNLDTPLGFSDESGSLTTQLEPNSNYLIFVKKPGYLLKEHYYTSSAPTSDQEIRIPLQIKDCANVNGKVINQKTGAAIPFAQVSIKTSCDGKIIDVKADGEGHFELCLAAGCTAIIRAEQQGYIQGILNVNNPKGNKAELPGEVRLLPFDNTPVASIESGGSGSIAKGTVIVLDNIYYDFNNAYIRAGAGQELDALYKLMAMYPTMSIELTAHTDSRGEKAYNKELSIQRAISAKNYLISKGINSDRITTQGKGEEEPRNKCKDDVNCTEEEYQYNRRTEVRVTAMEDKIDVKYGNKGPEVIDPKRN